MKKIKKLIAGILMAGIFSLSFTGCTTFDNFKEAFVNKNPQSDDTIRIGVYEPMSGADKEFGELEVRGIELAHELYPEVMGKKVELIPADNKSEIEAADTAMADLMKKMPLAVLGSYGSIYSLVANDHLEAAKVPGIAITNINPLVTKNHSYYFRACFVESYQGEALARYVYEQLKQNKSGLLVPENDDQATAMASNFKNKLIQLTNDTEAIAVYQKFTPGDTDFTQQLQAIANSRVGTVFLPGDTTEAANILEQAKKMGLSNITFLGDSDWGTDEFMDLAGKYIDSNVAFSTLYTEEKSMTARSQEFLDAYSKKYGKDAAADAATALGFDAYLLAISAIERAGEGCTGEDVRAALAETTKFQGASGEITFDSVGDPKKSVVINTITAKKITPLCTIEPATPEKKAEKKKHKKEEKENGTEN